VLAHVVTFGTDGLGWWCIHGSPRDEANLTVQVELRCRVLHSPLDHVSHSALPDREERYHAAGGAPMRQLIFGTLALAVSLGGVVRPASQLPGPGTWVIVTHPDKSTVLVPVSRNEMYIQDGPLLGFAQPPECPQPTPCANPPELAFMIRAWKEGGKARVVVYARLQDKRSPEGVTETAVATFALAPGEARDVGETEKWGGPRLIARSAVQ